MTKKEIFINYINEQLPNLDNEAPSEVKMFWDSFKEEKGNSSEITENGLKILKYMQENEENSNNLFKAKDVAEGLFITSRSVSGAMRKLVTDGYVTKIQGNPVVYSLAPAGRELTF